MFSSILKMSLFPCENTVISASYDWHASFDDALDASVSKAVSDILNKRNIWSLNSYRSSYDLNIDEKLDNLKFAHPFIITDKKSGEQIRIPEIVFQILSGIKSGSNTISSSTISK